MLHKSLRGLFHVVVSFGVLLLIWQLGVQFAGVNTALFPAPKDVVDGFRELIEDGTLQADIADSMLRFAIGYLSSIVVAIVLGSILGWFSGFWAFVNPIVQFLRPISPIAWLPFIVLWFGIGDIPAVVIIFIAGFFPVLLNTVRAVREVHPTYLKVAENFGIKGFSVMTKIVLPAAFPTIMSGVHLALGTAWVFLVAGEMVGAQTGLGYLIVDARNNLRVDLLMSAIVTIGVIGFVLDALLGLLERSVFKKWGAPSTEKGV